MSFISREQVIGKKAITPDGNTLGTVKDLAFSMKGDIGLILTKKDESQVTISVKNISAIGEFILVSVIPAEVTASSPPLSPASQIERVTTCPSCGNQVKAGVKFCGKCGTKMP